MSTREQEAILLDRCVAVGKGNEGGATSQIEANVFRLAGMIIRTNYKAESARLIAASETYFAVHPDELVPSAEIVRSGWIISAPRLRDSLERLLAAKASQA